MGSRIRGTEERKLTRQVLFACLAVVCTRWLVSFAHATEPRASRVFLDFITFCIIEFWFLVVRAQRERMALTPREGDIPSHKERFPGLS